MGLPQSPAGYHKPQKLECLDVECALRRFHHHLATLEHVEGLLKVFQMLFHCGTLY